jgi:hypothetical protein
MPSDTTTAQESPHCGRRVELTHAYLRSAASSFAVSNARFTPISLCRYDAVLVDHTGASYQSEVPYLLILGLTRTVRDN